MSDDALVQADPLPRILAWLGSHTAVVAALGVDRISDENEGPYPHVKVTQTASDEGDLRWIITTDVMFEVYADLDGTPDRATLLTISRTITSAVEELQWLVPDPGDPSINKVRCAVGATPAQEPTGQRKVRSIVRVWSHP